MGVTGTGVLVAALVTEMMIVLVTTTVLYDVTVSVKVVVVVGGGGLLYSNLCFLTSRFPLANTVCEERRAKRERRRKREIILRIAPSRIFFGRK